MVAHPLVEEGVGALAGVDDVGFELGWGCALESDVEVADQDFQHEFTQAGLFAWEAEVIADGIPEGFGRDEVGNFLPEGIFGFEESLHQDLADDEGGIGGFEFGGDGEHGDRQFTIVCVGGKLEGLEGLGPIVVEEGEVLANEGFEEAIGEAEVGVEERGGFGGEGSSGFLEVEEPVFVGSGFGEGGVEQVRGVGGFD